MKFVSPHSDTDRHVLSDAYMQGERPTLRRRVHARLLKASSVGNEARVLITLRKLMLIDSMALVV
jgi:hypothetical protein